MMAGTPNRRPYWTGTATVPLTEDERNDFAAQIKEMVSDFTLTYTWLIRRLSDEGLFTDKFEMSATLSGTRRGEKADEILRRSLDILHEYDERMGSCEGT